MAGGLAYNATNIPTRSYKFEVYHFAPAGGERISTDWHTLDAEIWSGILECDRVEPWVDRCRFRDEVVVYSFHVDATTELHRHPLTMKGEIELGYTPQGLVSRWDVKGRRAEFWQTATEALRQQRTKPDAVRYTPDDERRIGERMEQIMMRKIMGAFELPLSDAVKYADDKPYWPLSKTLNVSHLLLESTSSLRGIASTMSQEDSIATVGIEAKTSQGVETQTVSARIVGLGKVDTDLGTLVSLAFRVAYTSQGTGWYTQRTSLLEPVEDWMTSYPGELARNPLTDE